jgi:hypothetical protein
MRPSKNSLFGDQGALAEKFLGDGRMARPPLPNPKIELARPNFFGSHKVRVKKFPLGPLISRRECGLHPGLPASEIFSQ